MSSDSPSEEAAISIVRRLTENGFESYFAGGCVRDKIMNLPVKDYDIATAARPDQVAELFAHTVPVGVQFGVLIVVLRCVQYEVSTFRSDHGYSDGRHPDQVTFTTSQEDANRRDFTLNGMFYDPLSRETIDYVGGLKDIANKMIRAIRDPDERFGEDRLRMLRAIRFAVRFDFTIEENTYRAIQRHAAEIDVVSSERIREEMTKVLIGPGAGKALRLLRSSGLLKAILPDVDAMAGVRQPEQFHPEGDVFEHTCIMLDQLNQPSEVLAWSTLLHDIGKPETYCEAKDRIRFHNHNRVGARTAGRICRKLRFSNDVTSQICACVDNHMNFMHVKEMRPSKLKRLSANDGPEGFTSSMS